MRALVYLVHASPVVREAYEAELDALDGVDADLVFVNAGAFSGSYRQLAARLRMADGRILPSLLDAHPPPRPASSYDTIVGASFSAGYAFWRDVLAVPADAAMLGGIVGIDSWHAGFDPDATAKDAQLASLLAFARRAQDEPLVCWIGHSDVPTPRPGTPNAFASTTEVAEELLRLLGLAPKETKHGTRAQVGGLLVEAFDVRANMTQEHVAALNQWGPKFLGNAVGLLEERRAEAGLFDLGPPTVDLRRDALDLALRELGKGVVEIPGGKHHPRILAYFRGCERDGVNIGQWLQADEYAWCAAFASWCGVEAAQGLPGILPHRWRAAVRELWADGIASGAAISAAKIRRGEADILEGDLWIGTRGGPVHSDASPFAATQGKGHTGRIRIIATPEDFRTVDGNVNNRITEVGGRSILDRHFVGVLRYPGSSAPEANPPVDDEELDDLRSLIDALGEGVHGVAESLRRVNSWWGPDQ